MSSGLYPVPFFLETPKCCCLDHLVCPGVLDSLQGYTAKCFWYLREGGNTVVRVCVCAEERKGDQCILTPSIILGILFFSAKAF